MKCVCVLVDNTVIVTVSVCLHVTSFEVKPELELPRAVPPAKTVAKVPYCVKPCKYCLDLTSWLNNYGSITNWP